MAEKKKRAVRKKSAGQPKRFASGEKLCGLFERFCREIAESGYDRIPSQTEFCRWLEENYKPTDRKTIYSSLNKYFPAVKKDFERLQSDLIAQGGMLGKYQSAMSIFVLKNWCRWADKPEGTMEEREEKQADLLTAIERAVRDAD